MPLDIIGVTETWLNDSNQDFFKLKNYNFINLNCSNKNGGGIGIYVKEGLKYKLRADININLETAIESIFIQLVTPVGKNMIIGVIYRPPSNKIDLFENEMNQILRKLDKENKIGFLLGDFNVDLLKSESCDYTCRFLEQMFTSSFFPLILRPTRITQHTGTLYKKYLHHPTANNKNTYKRCKNKLNHIIKGAKKKFYEEPLIDY